MNKLFKRGSEIFKRSKVIGLAVVVAAAAPFVSPSVKPDQAAASTITAEYTSATAEGQTDPLLKAKVTFDDSLVSGGTIHENDFTSFTMSSVPLNLDFTLGQNGADSVFADSWLKVEKNGSDVSIKEWRLDLGETTGKFLTSLYQPLGSQQDYGLNYNFNTGDYAEGQVSSSLTNWAVKPTPMSETPIGGTAGLLAIGLAGLAGARYRMLKNNGPV